MSPESERSAAASRVGLLVLMAAAIVAAAILLIGDRQNLFTRKNLYYVRLGSVSGLAVGSNVQLNGVPVGSIERIVLPQDMGQTLIEVWFTIDARYAQRIRRDSVARIKTLGLLGDKYLEITSGSPAAEVIPGDGEIPAAPQTNVEQLTAAGEDVVNHIVTISAQLSRILGRMERGEGLLGELTMDVSPGRKVSAELLETLEALKRVAETIERGSGPLPRLIHDEELGNRLSSSVERLDALLTRVDEGKGLAGSLLSDEEQKARFTRTLEGLERAATRLGEVADKLERGDALLPKLLSDEEYGKQTAEDLRRMIESLRSVAEKLDKGDGSAARLINDPAFAEALDDIVIGVNESKMLRWLIRNRQQKGIEKRYEDAGGPAKSSDDAP